MSVDILSVDILSYNRLNEKQWAQIEKECLAAAENFHIFLFSLKFEINTDHKPLVSLINTIDLTEAPANQMSTIINEISSLIINKLINN